MLKKIISVMLTVLLSTPVAANAAVLYYGFEDAGGTTETQNEYFFQGFDAILVENKEPYTDFDYEDIYAGSYILLPLMVFVDGAKKETAVTDKMIKNDNIALSYKVMRGAGLVGELSIVDGKKLKLPDVPAGSYVKIPFAEDFASTGKSTVSVQLVLSVNGVTYQYTQTTLNCRLRSYRTDIRRNSIYGALRPTVFMVDDKYSGEATFDFGGDIIYTAKVKKKGVYFLNLSREKDPDIAAMYPGAYLDFYNFKGTDDKFASTGKLVIPVNVSSLSKKGVAPSLYVYRIDGDTLTSLAGGGISFDKTLGKLTINTSSLDNYVLSNQPLNRTVTAADSNILKSGYAETQTPAA